MKKILIISAVIACIVTGGYLFLRLYVLKAKKGVLEKKSLLGFLANALIIKNSNPEKKVKQEARR